MGLVPGVDDRSKGATITFENRPWDDASHFPAGRALVAITVLFSIGLVATNRFRGFRLNVLALIAAFGIAGYTGGPLVLAGGLSLAVAGWKKARG